MRFFSIFQKHIDGFPITMALFQAFRTALKSFVRIAILGRRQRCYLQQENSEIKMLNFFSVMTIRYSPVHGRKVCSTRSRIDLESASH